MKSAFLLTLLLAECWAVLVGVDQEAPLTTLLMINLYAG